MDLLVLPTLDTSIDNEVAIPRASPTYVHAPIVNDQ
jgi:hypothetical protein